MRDAQAVQRLVDRRVQLRRDPRAALDQVLGHVLDDLRRGFARIALHLAHVDHQVLERRGVDARGFERRSPPPDELLARQERPEKPEVQVRVPQAIVGRRPLEGAKPCGGDVAPGARVRVGHVQHAAAQLVQPAVHQLGEGPPGVEHAPDAPADGRALTRAARRDVRHREGHELLGPAAARSERLQQALLPRALEHDVAAVGEARALLRRDAAAAPEAHQAGPAHLRLFDPVRAPGRLTHQGLRLGLAAADALEALAAPSRPRSMPPPCVFGHLVVFRVQAHRDGASAGLLLAGNGLLLQHPRPPVAVQLGQPLERPVPLNDARRAVSAARPGGAWDSYGGSMNERRGTTGAMKNRGLRPYSACLAYHSQLCNRKSAAAYSAASFASTIALN